MRVMRSVLSLALLAGAAAPAFGQTFRFDSGTYYSNPAAWGARVGPYRGTLLAVPGQPTVDIFCVDYLHTVSNGQSWNATYSNMGGSLLDTYGYARWGDVDIARERYEVAALLATKFLPGNKSEWGAIHGAIWNLMSDGTAMYGSATVGGDAASQNLLSGAFADVSQGTDGIDPSDWLIISDADVNRQEFITQNVVPEPETVILLVTGLLALGAVAYFRGISA
jgi:hypothetical protein